MYYNFNLNREGINDLKERETDALKEALNEKLKKDRNPNVSNLLEPDYKYSLMTWSKVLTFALEKKEFSIPKLLYKL